MTMEEMFDTNGWDIVEIQGVERYVTRDDRGVAHVARGIVRHARRGRKGRGSAAQPAQTDPDATILLPSSKELGGGWRARWSRRLKDREWHRAVQHAAVDVAMWACMLALSAVSLKAAYWVVVL